MKSIKKTFSYSFIYSLVFMLDNEISSFLSEIFYKIILFAHICETFSFIITIIFINLGFIICLETQNFVLTESMIAYLANFFHLFSPTFFLRNMSGDTMTLILQVGITFYLAFLFFS